MVHQTIILKLPGLTKCWCQFADFKFCLWYLSLFLLILFQIKKANGAETHDMRAKIFTNIYDVSSFLILRKVNYSFLHSRLIRRRRIMRWPAWRIFWRSSHLVCQVNHHIRRSVSYICYSQGNLRVLAAILLAFASLLLCLALLPLSLFFCVRVTTEHAQQLLDNI